MKSLLIIFPIMILALGCAYPTSGVKVSDNRPTIAIQNAPEGAILIIDGLNMGLANQYDGQNKALLVEPGTHKIEVVNQGKIFLSEKVFLGVGEFKAFQIHTSGKTK